MAALRGPLQRSSGSACARTTRTCRPARPTSTSAGRWSIRRNGCRTATSCIRVDSRGAGRSPGVIDIWSLREAQDLAQCVEWAGVQPWSNGKVGLNGISYYAENQWQARGAAAQAPRRDLPVGGRRRLLPRHGAPRRHLLQRLHQGLVALAGLHAAARPRNARLQEPHERRLGVGPDRADRRGARRQPPQFLRGLPRPQARHRRVLAVAHAGLVEGEGAAVLGRQLGRPGPAPARQFRGLRARRLEAEMARVPRPRALDAFLHRLRRRAAEEVLRPFPQGREDRLGQAAEGAAAGASHRQVRRAAREGMAAQAHASGPSSSSTRRTSRCRPSGRRRNRR